MDGDIEQTHRTAALVEARGDIVVGSGHHIERRPLRILLCILVEAQQGLFVCRRLPALGGRLAPFPKDVLEELVVEARRKRLLAQFEQLSIQRLRFGADLVRRLCGFTATLRARRLCGSILPDPEQLQEIAVDPFRSRGVFDDTSVLVLLVHAEHDENALRLPALFDEVVRHRLKEEVSVNPLQRLAVLFALTLIHRIPRNGGIACVLRQVDVQDDVKGIVELDVAVDHVAHRLNARPVALLFIPPVAERALHGDERLILEMDIEEHIVWFEFCFGGIDKKCMHTLSDLNEKRLRGA